MNFEKRMWEIFAISALIGMMLFAGCVGQPPTPTPTPTPTATPTPTPTATPTPTVVKHPDTVTVATIGEPETLDPAWAYDTASGEVIFNVYETLIFFDGEHTDKFVPRIATKVPSVENGLIKKNGTEIWFPIREGIYFHNGDPLTAEDVEYSFERAMVQDRDGGPVWMLLEPLLGVDSTRDSEGNIVVSFEDIDKAVEVRGGFVVFHLKQQFPITTFFQILSQTWSSIVDKKFCIEHGDWPGTAETWKQYNNPEVPPLQEIMCGTGPFKLLRWEKGSQVILERNDKYWRGPAKIKWAVIKKVDEWSDRKLMFINGDADIVYVPTAHIKELEGVEGIRVVKDLPELVVAALFFTFDIDPESPYIGSGKLDGQGVPPNFFNDKNIRLAFAYSFDYDTYLKEAWLGEAEQPASPVIKGLPYRNPEQEKFTFDLDKAKSYFKVAFNGEVWKKGFTMDLLYNTGNEQRKIAAEVLKENIESLNPKFHINVRAVEWPIYLRAMVRGQLPCFIIGWLADYPDPHNFVHPFMHSQGAFAAWQHYSNPEVDKLIDEGIRTINPDARKQIYYKLQEIYHEDVPSVPLYQPLGRHWERTWLHGWYYNPIYPGVYFYPLWKG